MSQNSIITTVIAILAIIVGVYFFFTSSSTPTATPDYNPKTGADTATPVDNEYKRSEFPIIDSSKKPAQPAPIENTNNTTPDTHKDTETSTGNEKTSNPAEPKVQVPIVIKYNYNVNIKGTVASNSPAFVIKAISTDGLSEDFAQDKLADGSYKFESLKIFSSVSINVEGYAPVLKENLALINNRVTIDIAMEAFATVAGDVKSFLEKPVSGATVTIESGAYKKVLHADTKGEFKLAEKIPGGQYSLTIIHPQFDSKKMVVELAKGEDKIVNIKLERDALLEGTVVTSEGKAAGNMEGVLKFESDEAKSKPFTTDEKGHFQLSKIVEGKYSLVFNSMLGSLVEPLAFAKNIEMVREFKMLPPPSVAGVLVDEAGKPVAGVKLFTFDDKSIVEDETKADGKFNLVLVKKGNYRVLTNSEIYELVSSTKLYEPTLEKVVIQVKKKTFLKGKILNTSGQAINKDLTLKLVNKTKKSQNIIFTYIKKDNKVLIPMSTFKFISPDDDIQISVESTTFGKGVSLTMKAGSLSEENEFIVTLGE